MADGVSFSESYDPCTWQNHLQGGRLIVPHCFRDFNSGSIGRGRGEKEGGTEVNKKDKTGSSGKQGGKRKQANKREEEARDKFHQGLAQ